MTGGLKILSHNSHLEPGHFSLHNPLNNSQFYTPKNRGKIHRANIFDFAFTFEFYSDLIYIDSTFSFITLEGSPICRLGVSFQPVQDADSLF